MTLLSRLCLLATLAAVIPARADTTQPAGDWDVVSIDPISTSIYIGSVRLSATAFKRQGDVYTAQYEAKVRPWFWWSETGEISIRVTAADLERLNRGERIEFTGDARNHKHKPRHVTGRADREDAASGKIKVRIGVDGTELVFNTHYHFNNARK